MLKKLTFYVHFIVLLPQERLELLSGNFKGIVVPLLLHKFKVKEQEINTVQRHKFD